MKRHDFPMKRIFLLFLVPLMILSLSSCRKKTIAETEPNDTERDATVIEAGVPVRGTISSSQDSDIFTIEIEEDASFDISLSAVKGVNHALKIWRQSDPGSVKLVDDARKSSAEAMTGLWLDRGRWFIAVIHGDRDVPKGAPDISYTLFLKPHEAEGQFEREPNDSIDHANPIDTAKSVTGHYSPSFNKLSQNADAPLREDDWFSFKVDTAEGKPTIVRAELSAVPGVTPAVELFTPDRTLASKAEAPVAGGTAVINGLAVSVPGTYFLCVHSRAYESNGEKPYSLTVTFPEFDPSKESEPNDSRESAHAFNPPFMDGRISPSGDRDVCSFTSEEPSLLRLEVTVPPSLDLLVRAYSEEGTEIAQMNGSGGTTIVIPDVYFEKTAYCEVSALSGKNDPAASYRLSAVQTPYSPEIEMEPNGTKAEATKITGKTMIGYLTGRKDKDWYVYECAPRSNRSVTVTGIEGAAFTVSITDQNGNVIRTEKMAGKKPRTFKEIFDKKGFIIIESQKEVTTEPYTLTVK